MLYTFILLAGLVTFLAARLMLPMRAVRNQLGTLLAADATTLAPATNANKVAVIIATFTLGDGLLIGNLTLANSNGLDPILCATGAQLVGLDPNSGVQVITMKAAAVPGFRWTTSGTFPPTITVFGFALIDNAGATLLGVSQLGTPIPLTAVGQIVDANDVNMSFVSQPIS